MALAASLDHMRKLTSQFPTARTRVLYAKAGTLMASVVVTDPARAAGLERFLDHVLAHDDVWVARRIDVAWHWHAHHRPA